jgi:hypothetical protein
MTLRVSIAIAALIALAHSASAQEVSGRIDLDLLAALPQSSLVAARIVFTETDVVCPADHGVLQISDGVLRHHKAVILGNRDAAGFSGMTPVNDETFQFAITAKNCRVEIGVRQQVRRNDDAWTSLLVRKRLRPSLSPEERRKAEEQFRNDRPNPVRPENLDRLLDARNARRGVGSLAHNVGSLSSGFGFEDTPRECFEALGNYSVDQQGVTFSFVTNLPGRLNRFLLERVDVDEEHSRLLLTRGDCRFEFTVGASVLRDDQWRVRPIAPFRPVQIQIIRKPADGGARIEVK